MMCVEPWQFWIGISGIVTTGAAIVFLIVILVHDERCRRRERLARRDRIASDHGPSWKSPEEEPWDPHKHGPTVESRQWPPSRW